MDENWEARAFANEVRAEMLRQGVTARGLQAAVGSGLSSSAYQKYFVQQTRPIPSDIQLAVCGVLRVKLSEMWRRAEAEAPRLAERGDPIRAELEAGLGRAGKRALRDVEGDVADPAPARRRPGRTTRATDATEDAADEERGRAAG